MYRYDVDRNSWSRVTSPNSPPPRSAHQAVAHKGYVYVFGGEFTSPNQEKFHHYRDLWRLVGLPATTGSDWSTLYNSICIMRWYNTMALCICPVL